MATKKILALAHEEFYNADTQQVFYILAALVKRGFETVLVSNSEKAWLGQAIQQNELPIKTYFIPLIRKKFCPFQELKLLFHLIRIFQEEKPDVVFASDIKFIVLTGIAGWIAGVPQRIGIIRDEGAPPGSQSLKTIYNLQWIMARLGTTFITVSEYLRQQMLKRNIANEQAISTIPNGIDPTIFQGNNRQASELGLLTRRHQLPPNAFKIGMVGNFVPGKRYDQFIEMLRILCQKHRHVYGFLIGQGKDRELLQTQINESGFAHRIWIEEYSDEKKSGIYQDLDLTVLFTDYEGCSNAVLESFAAGVPVVASQVGGMSELIETGRNGYLVNPDDMPDTIRIISPLVSNPALCQTMGQHGAQMVLQKFNLEQQLDRMVDALISPNQSTSAPHEQ